MRARRPRAPRGAVSQPPDARPSPDRIAHSVTIACSKAAVFAYVADACNQPAWCSAIRGCRQTSLTRPGHGAAYEVTRPIKAPWRPRTSELYMTTHAPASSLHWTRREGATTTDITCEIDAVGRDSVLWYTETLRHSTPSLLHALDVLIRRYEVPRDLWRLKDILEQAQEAANVAASEQQERVGRRPRPEPGSAAGA
jgi:hypothetical protein